MSVWSRKTGPRPLLIEAVGLEQDGAGEGLWTGAQDRTGKSWVRGVLLGKSRGGAEEAAGRRRGARGGLGGLPSSAPGEAGGTDDALSPSPSSCGSWARVQLHSQQEAGAGL